MTKVVLPDPAWLCAPPGRQGIDPLLSSAERGRRARRGGRQRVCQTVKGIVGAVDGFEDGVSRWFAVSGNGNWHLQNKET